MRCQLRGVAGLRQEIRCAESGALGDHMGIDEPGKDKHRRRVLLRSQPPQYAQAVQPRLHEIEQHDVRTKRLDRKSVV